MRSLSDHAGCNLGSVLFRTSPWSPPSEKSPPKRGCGRRDDPAIPGSLITWPRSTPGTITLPNVLFAVFFISPHELRECAVIRQSRPHHDSPGPMVRPLYCMDRSSPDLSPEPGSLSGGATTATYWARSIVRIPVLGDGVHVPHPTFVCFGDDHLHPSPKFREVLMLPQHDKPHAPFDRNTLRRSHDPLDPQDGLIRIDPKNPGDVRRNVHGIHSLNRPADRDTMSARQCDDTRLQIAAIQGEPREACERQHAKRRAAPARRTPRCTRASRAAPSPHAASFSRSCSVAFATPVACAITVTVTTVILPRAVCSRGHPVFLTSRSKQLHARSMTKAPPHVSDYRPRRNETTSGASPSIRRDLDRLSESVDN